MKTEICISLASDNNYADYALVTIFSSAINLDSSYRLKVYILDGGIKSDKKQMMLKILERFDMDVVFLDMTSETLFDDLPILMHWSKAMYYRVLLFKMLGDDISKVIYLDCDLMVTESLHKLYNYNLTNLSAAVIADSDQASNNRLNLPLDNIYFNSGVMLINLSYWRNEYNIDYIRSFINDYDGYLESPDQDLLNILLANKVKYLDAKWNMQVGMYRSRVFWKKLYTAKGIFHFTTNVKPWAVDDPHPQAKYYRFLAKNIGIELQELIGLISGVKKIKRFIFHYLPFWVYSKLKGFNF